MADVFISYASEDRDRVRPLAEALLARGFNIWWDRSLAAGQDYAAIIERELNSAKAVIVVWTRGSAASTFVRDEAGRARDEGRLVPVLLDAVQLPLGFGAFQAEDFTKWNGGSNAPQIQLLEEVLKAKLSGREVDGGAIERRRRRLGTRIRIVSLLTVVALVVGIAAGLNNILNPSEPEVVRTDVRAELLRLLEEGKLTPEQAIQLAQILESGALGAQQVALNEAPSASDRASSGPAAPAPGAAETRAAGDAEVQLAAVSEAEFDAAARETYQAAVTDLLLHSSQQVRTAAVNLSNPANRDRAIQALWDFARENPSDAMRQQIYLVCGAVGERNNNPLGQRALEQATNLAPERSDVWRMLSRSYSRTDQTSQAQAAALVSEGVEARAQGRTGVAEERLQQALPNIEAPALRASVVSELGQIAEQRDDATSASARFAEAYRLREEAAAAAPNSTASEALEADAQQLVRALDRSGRTREACEHLRQAQESHDVAAPDQDLLDRCQRLLRAPLRSRVELAPRLRQPAPAAQQAPAP
jgi:tetratricopeptide (TPR) repeat protein